MKGHVNLAWASDHLQLFKLARLFIFVLFLRNRLNYAGYVRQQSAFFRNLNRND